MGQTESKLIGSYTFAYMKSNLSTTSYNTIPITTPELILEEKEEEEEGEEIHHDNSDHILKSPETYGLRMPSSSHPFLPPSPTRLHQQQKSSISSSSSSVSTIVQKHPSSSNHRDSGYVSPSFYDESIQLVNDLTYVDFTYYNKSSSRPNITNNNNIKTNDQQQQKQCSEVGAQISFTDVMLTSTNNDLREVYLAWRSIHSLSPNIGMLTMIRKLDLSHNYLIELPNTIGYLQNLEVLNISKNQLSSLPDTIGYLSNLKELDVSHNEIQQLTPYISYFKKLKILSLAYNRIQSLPTAISGLGELISLDLTRNPLKVLPAEISQLPFLRRMRLEDCPFITGIQQDIEYSLPHDPPSLLEICARNIKKGGGNAETTLPHHLQNYMQSAKSCTSCHGPYFESFVLRGRLMEKTDLHIPLEYSLCSAHWSNNDDRILSMFGNQPTTTFTQSTPFKPDLPALPKLAAMEECSNSVERGRFSITATSLRNKRQAAGHQNSFLILPASSAQRMDSSTIITTTDPTYDDINEVLYVPTAAVSSTTTTNTIASKLFSSSSGKSNLVMSLTTRLKRAAR